MKRTASFLLCLLLLGIPARASAQTEEPLSLNFSRDWGYSGFGGEIQGTFSMHVTGPEALKEVWFLVDGTVVRVDPEPPFRYQFETGAFAPGQHTLAAIGVLADGTQLRSAALTRQFLSKEEADAQTRGLVFPMLLGIGAIALLGVAGPLLLSRKKRFTPGQYGLAGGAICPRCSLPYSRGIVSPNLLAGKLERCPHCGKWAVVRRAPPAELEAAERRLASRGEAEAAIAPLTEEERMRKLLDASRFEG